MNGERTETFLPGIHRADYILRQLSLMSSRSGLCSLALTFIWQPYRCRYPTVIHVCLNLLPAIQPFSSITFYSFDLSYRLCIAGESFFCEVTLDLSNCKACPVNNLPLGKYCLKSILHDSLALFALSALLKAEKSSRNTAERL